MNHLSLPAATIRGYLPEPYASLTNGMVFGIPLSHSGSLTLDIRKAGLMHLVVLSGMNITLIHDSIRKITAVFGRKASCMISILTIFIFSYLVGFEAPITRALISTTLTNVCVAYGRKPHTLLLFLLTGLLCLSVVPAWLSSISFQLSYAATLGILLASTKESPPPEKTHVWSSLYAYIRSDLRTTMGAQLLTVPIIWYYFRQISLISPLSNLLVSWTVLPLTIAATGSALSGMIFQPLGMPLGYISYTLAWYIAQVIHGAASVPYSFLSLGESR